MGELSTSGAFSIATGGYVNRGDFESACWAATTVGGSSSEMNTYIMIPLEYVGSNIGMPK